VDEHILATVFTLDEAETLLDIEEFHDALALADDLRRHPTRAATTARGTKATTAAASTTAKAATAGCAEAAAPAGPTPAAATESVAAATAEAITTASAAAATERIKAFLAEPVALVSAPAATSSIKTHKPERTFASPIARRSATWTIRADRQEQGRIGARHCPWITVHIRKKGPLRTDSKVKSMHQDLARLHVESAELRHTARR
jgi:hypothetical protein